MYRQEKKYYQKAFFYALIMACILLLPFVIIDGGYFIYYGDFNAQQIPFYKTCIRAVQEGNFGWNWQTDLGANFIGSYSFYTLGSPFFWLAALFPASISHYFMAPLLALKLAFSSLFAFIYIRRFVRKADTALVGGLLYAFSSYSMYNLFFNHFHEAVVFFPLLLIALEEAVVNKRRGALALAVAINAFVNYFFFIGECVFLVLYFVVRISCDKRFRISVGDFFCLAFECVVGVAIACVLFVPSIFQVLDVPRSTKILTDSSFLFYGKEQRYGVLLEAMFFPPEIPARTYMFPEADAKWSSIALYLPLFSVAGALAFMRSKGSRWVKALMAVCVIFAFIPGLNASFTMFNNNCYMRWFYMPELIICLATVHAVENAEQRDFRFGIVFSAVVSGAMALLVMLHPVKATDEVSGEEYVTLRVLNDINGATCVQFIIAGIFMLFLCLLIRERGKNAAGFAKTCLSLTIISGMVLGYYFVAHGRMIGPYVGKYNKTVRADIHIDDPEFYRMEAFGIENNANMFWDMSSLKSFTSVIPSATFELYDLVGYNRTVNSAPDPAYFALRSMMGVKYYIVPRDQSKELAQNALDSLKIYEFHTTYGEYDIYKNDYAFPMGYTFDSYVTYEAAEKHSSAEKLMCRAVVLTEEQIQRHSDILTALPKSDVGKVSLDRFKYDAQARIESGVDEFAVTKSGFTARTSYDSDELVVFSVPFDKGWSATVNGSPVTVEKVSGGLVAVRVPEGENSIVFSYATPGLKYGLMLTAGGAVLYALYMLIQYVVLKRKPRRYAHLYELEISGGVAAHSSYISHISKLINEAPEKGRIDRPDVNEAEYEAVRRSLEESAAKLDTEKNKKRGAFYLNDGEEALEILRSIEKKRDE